MATAKTMLWEDAAKGSRIRQWKKASFQFFVSDSNALMLVSGKSAASTKEFK